MVKKSKRSATFKVNSKNEIVHTDFIENLNKLLGSWFKNKDILTPVSNKEAENTGTLLPTLFQANHKPEASRDAKTRKASRRQSRFYIDIRKLEKSSSINKEEKLKLKRLIQEIKCENPGESKCSSESRKKKTVIKKVNNTFFNESKRKKGKWTHGKHNEKKGNANKSAKPKAKRIKSFECQTCLGVVQNKANTSRRKKRKQSSTITESKEKVLQTILELDPRAHGDTISSSKLCQSAWPRRLTTGSKEGQNINIRNIELKYVNPTYVVQYSTTATNNAPEVGPEEDPKYGRQRFYSSAALEAHLGQRPALNVEGRSIERDVTMHYEPSSDHVIGVGQETERMKVEVQREMSLRQSMRQSLAQKQREQAEKIREEEMDPRVSIIKRRPINGEVSWPERGLQKQVTIEEPWLRRMASEDIEFDQDEYRTFSLKPKEQVLVKGPTVEKNEAFVDRKWPKCMRDPMEVLSQYGDCGGEHPRVAPTNEHRCKKLRGFLRKWLCLSPEEGSQADIAGGKTTGIKPANKKAAQKPAKVHKPGLGERSVVRITEEEFNRDQAKSEKQVTFDDLLI